MAQAYQRVCDGFIAIGLFLALMYLIIWVGKGKDPDEHD
jgi:hypothetical protein